MRKYKFHVLMFLFAILIFCFLAWVLKDSYPTDIMAPLVVGLVLFVFSSISKESDPINPIKEAIFLHEKGIITNEQYESMIADATEKMKKHTNYKKYFQ